MPFGSCAEWFDNSRRVKAAPAFRAIIPVYGPYQQYGFVSMHSSRASTACWSTSSVEITSFSVPGRLYNFKNLSMFMVEASPVTYRSSRVSEASASMKLWDLPMPCGSPRSPKRFPSRFCTLGDVPSIENPGVRDKGSPVHTVPAIFLAYDVIPNDQHLPMVERIVESPISIPYTARYNQPRGQRHKAARQLTCIYYCNNFQELAILMSETIPRRVVG